MKPLNMILCSMLAGNLAWAGNKAIVDHSNSPHVTFKGIGIGDCRWTTGFWADKFKLCEETMVPYMGEILKGDIGHGYNNFKIAAGLKEGEHGGSPWHDGDLYKWLEASVYVYSINKDPKILKELDEIIAVIGKAQEDDGYLHTYNQINGNPHFSSIGHHEMYDCGHLFTTACIHQRVTGKRNLLDIAIKNADLLYKTFQPQPKQLARFGYNQTQISGLVELYRTTGDMRYLELAGIFIDTRGNRKQDGLDATSPRKTGDHTQDRMPFRKETTAAGHAVLAMYLYGGAADVYAETGEAALLNSLDQIWANVVGRKMYVTGGVGQTHHGISARKDQVHECFAQEYVMPNSTAYSETCANVCNAMFNWRMLDIKGDSKYADIVELVLYNSGLSGIGVDGKCYFYANPLRRTFDQKLDNTNHPTRQPYLKCFCCPPNIVRTIAKASGWAYSLSENGVAVNLYGGNELNTTLLDGTVLKLIQETQYPWDGRIQMTINQCKTAPFDVRLRIPGWAEKAALTINGKHPEVEPVPGSFAVINRSWKAGDVIVLDLPLTAKLVSGHPRIEEVRNQAAVKRGPVVYCLETPDLPEGTEILDVYIPSEIKLKEQNRPDLLGGVTTLSGKLLLRGDQTTEMYRPIGKPNWKKVKTQLIPYFAWSNRGESEMTVFLPLIWE